MCSVFSEANGEDPCGSAPMWDHCLVIEIPTPWEHEVMDSPGFPAGVADILDQRPDVRLQVIQPDDSYSVEGHSRVMLFSRPDGPVRDMTRREYLVPSNRLLEVVTALLGGCDDELAKWEQHNNGMRDLLVCTHGSRDICCASIGQPTYMELHSPILELAYASLEAVSYGRPSARTKRDRHAEREILVKTLSCPRNTGS